MSVGRESIRRAANAGAGKTVKKPVVSTKEAEKPETISVTEEKKTNPQTRPERNRKQKRKKQQKVLFILMRNCRYIFFKSYL